MKGIVSFYGKTGCKGNARQKEQLKAAGYALQFIDLIEKKWEAHNLTKFFDGRRVHDCVNQRAPQITSGEFAPGSLNENELLQAMIETPILIKRPLIFYRGEFACGFDHPLIARLLGDRSVEDSCQRHAGCAHPDNG